MAELDFSVFPAQKPFRRGHPWSGRPWRNKCVLRESPGDEGISSIGAPACADQEHHVLPALELGSGLAEVFFTVDWLLVNFQDDHAGLDRKSTRLNSSHSQISY